MSLKKLSLNTKALKVTNVPSFWKQQVITCSAIESKNIDKVWNMVCEFQQTSKAEVFSKRRAQQSTDWMWSLIRDSIKRN